MDHFKRLLGVGITLLVLGLARVQAEDAAFPFPAFDWEGHRGARGLMPENTIPAMLEALKLGVTTLELDVVISRDRKVVVSHDAYLHHLFTLDPEGREFSKEEGLRRIVFEMDYAAVTAFDVGKKPHPDFPRQRKMAAVKPLLEDLIMAVEAQLKAEGRGPVWYNIETKSTAGKDGILQPAPKEFVDLLMAVLKSQGVAERTVIQSFDRRTLQVMQRDYPGMKTSFLISGSNKQSVEQNLHDLGFRPFIYSPDHRIVDAALVAECHRLGMKVVPWTANTLADLQRLVALQVDGIITDYPDLFAQIPLTEAEKARGARPQLSR